MNEEEKKATKMLDKFITEHKFYNIKHSDNLEDNIEIVLNLIEKLQKENKELKDLMAHKNTYTKKLEKDLFENCSNYVISKQKVKDKIEEILNNKEYRIVFEGNAEFPDDATIINAQKYIKLEKMQELIKEEEENHEENI